MRILVTGGCGFIGSALCRHLVGVLGHHVHNVDKLTYAASPAAVASLATTSAYEFSHCSINERDRLDEIFDRFRPHAVIHLAAESHVDRSIRDAGAFVETNVVGTVTLLNAAYDYWARRDAADAREFRFLHVSTDEVFGSLGRCGYFSEATAYAPSSPYAASKAAADHFVRAWHRTYGLPTLITTSSNNFGPYQFPEKLIPRLIVRALTQRPLPVYGDGRNVRDWLFVDDHVRALITVLERGTVGKTYTIGARNERTNLEVVTRICAVLDECMPSAAPHGRLIAHVDDRLGHDRRYASDPTRIEDDLGWRPATDFETALRRTVRWYLENETWWAGLSQSD